MCGSLRPQELKAAGAQERHTHYEHCRASWKQFHQGEREGKREVSVQVWGERRGGMPIVSTVAPHGSCTTGGSGRGSGKCLYR